MAQIPEEEDLVDSLEKGVLVPQASQDQAIWSESLLHLHAPRGEVVQHTLCVQHHAVQNLEDAIVIRP